MIPPGESEASGLNLGGRRPPAQENRGADDEIRTRDIDLGKVALYQLSYIRASAYRNTDEE
jgi:hypothetical protein